MVTLLRVGKYSVEVYLGGGVWNPSGFFAHNRRFRSFWIGGIRIAY